ncbi:MAG: hypothetical protein ACT4OH_05620 [Methylophilaceae bacterium]
MSSTTIKSLDKIKMLDQMLEDLAGEELDDFSEIDNNANVEAKRFSTADLSDIDNTH